jgi:hypothetical protein
LARASCWPYGIWWLLWQIQMPYEDLSVKKQQCDVGLFKSGECLQNLDSNCGQSVLLIMWIVYFRLMTSEPNLSQTAWESPC